MKIKTFVRSYLSLALMKKVLNKHIQTFCLRAVRYFLFLEQKCEVSEVSHLFWAAERVLIFICVGITELLPEKLLSK